MPVDPDASAASQAVRQRASAQGLALSEDTLEQLARQYPALKASTDLLPDAWSRAMPGSATSPSSPPAGAWQPSSIDDEGTDTVVGAASALRANRTTAVNLVTQALSAIEADDAQLGAMVAVFATSAMAAAERADQELAHGLDRGPLHGVPLVIKDNLTSIEAATRVQSKVHCPLTDELVDAASLSALRKAGAIILGKASTSEFTLGRAGPGFPDPRNPWDLSRWPGGSSSGTAVAIAGGLIAAGLGTDTGGSIRMPAALCGITGFKPTLGRIPATGCVPLAPSLDTVGPMAHSVADCALLFAALTHGAPIPALVNEGPTSLEGLRIGLMRPYLEVPDVDTALDGRLSVCASNLEGSGAEVLEVELPDSAAIYSAAFVILYTEAFNLHRHTLVPTWDDYGIEARNRLATGALYD